MPVEGKLELVVKLSALPTDVRTDKNGHKQFTVACGERLVTMTMRPKLFAKLTEAAAKWPSWVAAIAGQMGPSTEAGFVLLEPNVQVFEKKAKPSADASAPPPVAAVPSAALAPAGREGALRERVHAALVAALAAGHSLEGVCARHGVPLRQVQALLEPRPSGLTDAQQTALLQLLLTALEATTVGSAAS